MLDPVGVFGVSDHRGPVAPFLLGIFPVGICRALTCASVCLFDCSLGQCEAVVPPGRIPLAMFPKRNCNVGGFVNHVGNVKDGTKSVIFSTKVGEIHVGRLDVGGEGIPVCLVPGPSRGGGWGGQG